MTRTSPLFVNGRGWLPACATCINEVDPPLPAGVLIYASALVRGSDA